MRTFDNRRDKKDPKDLKTKKKKLFFRKKICRFCADRSLAVDYKEQPSLKPFVTERGKIIPGRITGNCRKHQRQVTLAVKRSRTLGIMPFTAPEARF